MARVGTKHSYTGLSFSQVRKNNKAYNETPKKGIIMETFVTELVVLTTPRDSEYETVIPQESIDHRVKVKAFLDTLNLG